MVEDPVEFMRTIRRTNPTARHFTIPTHICDRAGITNGDEIVVEILAVEKAVGGDTGGA